MCKVLLLVVALAVPAMSYAVPPAVQSFNQSSRNAWELCAWRALVAGTIYRDVDHFQETIRCVADSLNSVHGDFHRALGAAKSEQSKIALKNYHAKWMAGIQSLPALQRGPKAELERAKNQTSQTLNEAWGLVEMEL